MYVGATQDTILTHFLDAFSKIGTYMHLTIIDSFKY